MTLPLDILQGQLETARARANDIRDRLCAAIMEGDNAAEERLGKVHAAALEDYRALRIEVDTATRAAYA